MATWPEYIALVRHLDQLARSASEAATGAAQQQEAHEATIDALDQRLAAQQQRLGHLGQLIGQHLSSQPPPPAAEPDPAVAVRLAQEKADVADAAATEAESLAAQAPLLPGLSPLARNLLVYAGCAVVAVVLQFVLLSLGDASRLDPFFVFTGVCAGLPALAFFAAVLVISAWGKPRTVLGTFPRHPQLGFAICFLAMPTVYCAFKVVSGLVT